MNEAEGLGMEPPLLEASDAPVREFVPSGRVPLLDFNVGDDNEEVKQPFPVVQPVV